ILLLVNLKDGGQSRADVVSLLLLHVKYLNGKHSTDNVVDRGLVEVARKVIHVHGGRHDDQLQWTQLGLLCLWRMEVVVLVIRILRVEWSFGGASKTLRLL